MKKIIIVNIIIFLSLNLFAQENKYEVIEKQLTDLAKTYPALNEKVNISVSNVSIQEFIRAIAKNTNVNINVSPELNFNVINNFSGVKVVDMLIFLCKEYDLDIKIIGNIISINKNIPEQKPIVKKEVNVVFFSVDSTISLDLRNDTLYNVAKVITSKTGKNIILDPKVKDKSVTSYVQRVPIKKAIEMLTLANNLELNEKGNEFWIVEQPNNSISSQKSNNNVSKKKQQTKNDYTEETGINIIIKDSGNIDIASYDYPIINILKVLSDSLHVNYYIISDITGNANLNIKGLSYEEVLNNLFDGTDYTYIKNKNIYIFGGKTDPELLKTKVIQLKYRSIEELTDVIPERLTKNVSVKEFIDLNSFIISGPSKNVDELEQFLESIDKVVPVVLIEILIVEVSSNHNITTGISAGLNSSVVPTKTTGKFSPGVDVTLSTSTINNLINSFNGFGLFNIGKVTPEFYLSLKALEDNGNIRFESTPMLSTLNGKEATLSIGETTYYSEEKQNTIGSQNPQNIMTKTWKSIKADLSITIKPVVSGNDQVTLDIDVQQSDFTGKVAADSPPGSVDRSFKSLIRVKNQEMVLLGGLKSKKKSDSGSGLPWISRVPVLKWFTSSRTKENSKDKLTIFIKPTVIY